MKTKTKLYTGLEYEFIASNGDTFDSITPFIGELSYVEKSGQEKRRERRKLKSSNELL
jgi:hypothetical protein